jgi:RNA-directed DNA polymerase
MGANAPSVSRHWKTTSSSGRQSRCSTPSTRKNFSGSRTVPAQDAARTTRWIRSREGWKIEFGRWASERRQRRGQGKPETFDFLGLTHMCGTTERGKFTVRRCTIAKRLRKKLQEVKQTLRERMHWPIEKLGAWLKSVVIGHYRYYGVPRNMGRLWVFRERILRYWCHTIRRRSQRHRMPWQRMYRLATQWLPEPHIMHPYPAQRLRVTTQGRSPVR